MRGMSLEPTIYRFGGFELDAQRRLLRAADGQQVELTSKDSGSADLPRRASRRSRVQADPARGRLAKVVVEEHSLTQAVSSLRHALGERPSENRFIATVRGEVTASWPMSWPRRVRRGTVLTSQPARARQT